MQYASARTGRASAVELVREAVGGMAAGLHVGPAAKRVRAWPNPRRKGQKRDPRELEMLTGRLGDYIRRHPGKRIEQIAEALGARTKELALPAKKLMEAKKISTKGQKRAMRPQRAPDGGFSSHTEMRRPA
jgi:hypothetical protein